MKSKFNISAVFGLILAFILVIFVGIALQTTDKGYTINMKQIVGFIDVPSLAITIGGTMGAMIFSFPTSILKNVGKMVMMVFFPRVYNPQHYIEEMVEYCKIARSKGILQLEESANQCKEPFIKSSLFLIIDANDSEKVKSMLDDAIDFMCERHEANIAFWSKAAGAAPAFGMIGTLVGLINMLAGLDPSDSNSSATLGAGMSTALVTTFYGCIMAHVLFNPIANQLKSLHNRELLCMQIVEEGALAIISGANPRYVEEKLQIMLSESEVKGKKGSEANSK